MPDKFYVITIDADNFTSIRDLEAFHKRLIKTTGLKAWWHHLHSTYIIKVSHSVKAGDIANLIHKIAPKKPSFIAEINLNNTGGSLPKNAWTWIKNHTVSDSSFKY